MECSKLVLELPVLSRITAGRGDCFLAPAIKLILSAQDAGNAWTCVRGQVASTVRYCMTVGGTVVLVIGTLCFAWWSEDDTAIQPGSLAPTVKRPLPRISLTWLKSISLFCCSMGGLLLFSGLLWSIQDSTKRSSQGDLYQLSRDLCHLAAESPEKSCRPPKEAAIPTYEEAMYCPLAEGPLPSPVQPEEEDLQRHAPRDALLGSTSLLPPPSYESIIQAQEAVSGPHAASSSPGRAQAAGEFQGSSSP
ncbi:transmembrane protein 61 isoform X1 [Alexandromys fortis]|uniref:transmembrane protein 61 isoform X1 n=1 Tax=Alexandromys fortis TaxID=100897 RepID=UPI0021521421|nr:transmembrane protein 61 isoform X1 [Microtus fortis]